MDAPAGHLPEEGLPLSLEGRDGAHGVEEQGHPLHEGRPVGVIDEINILQAARLAMKQAVENLSVSPDMVLVDGNREIAVGMEQKTLVGGDRRCLSIAAASVLAKVTRDRLMQDLHRRFPGYGFDRHKGYGTELHRARIAELGPCLEHRKTFKGVKEYL